MTRWSLVLLLFLALLHGCTDGKVSFFPRDPEPAAPSKPPISVQQLARTLDLKMERSDALLARMSGPLNAITIFGNPNGAILVNGHQIGPAGDIASRSGELLIPRDRLEAIQKAMVRRPKKSKPQRLAPLKGMTVIVDAGHGGRDPGAISIRGDFEKHVNLAVTSKVVRLLNDQHIRVILSRRQDVFVDLDDRVALANKYNPDLFLSIHADSSPDATRRGATIYVPRRTNDTSSAARAGTKINAAMQSVTSSYGVKRHHVNLRVLEKTRCPAVLVELGYLTHRQESAQLVNADFQEKLAVAISRGVTAHLTHQIPKKRGLGK